MTQINLTDTKQTRNDLINVIMRAAQAVNSQMPEDNIAEDVITCRMYGQFGMINELRLLIELDYVLNWHTKFDNQDLTAAYALIMTKYNWFDTQLFNQLYKQYELHTDWFNKLETRAALSNWLNHETLERLSTSTLMSLASFVQVYVVDLV